MNTSKKHIIFILAVFALTFFSCDSTSKKGSKVTEDSKDNASETAEAASDTKTENEWIDESEAANLSSTWVDEEDKGELSNTWAEDAFAEELSDSQQTNSWVDADGETIYRKTEVPPDFVGGKDALFDYFKNNIQYPEDVQRGNVYVAFVVTKDGDIRDARIVKGINENCDKEALRLIKNMPKWDPGMQKGKIVSSVYGLPVIFRP